MSGTKPYRVAVTYGTFDLLHIGHLRLFQRIDELADRLIVGVSTDEFNALKGKRSVMSYEHRAELIANLRLVDAVIPEQTWDQKRRDVVEHGVDLVVMGDDWQGKFDDLRNLCQVLYLPRTVGVSSSDIRNVLHALAPEEIAKVQHALELAAEILREFSD